MIEPTELLWNGPADAAHTVVLAHGAGAAMDSPFMNVMAEGLAGAGIRVARFEFRYMQRHREIGQRKPPDGAAHLRGHWISVIEHLGGAGKLVIGGKSMGGRIASMLADELGARGLVCLGYPFHPPGRPDRLRTAHLATLETPTLIVQGTRDSLGSQEEIANYELSSAIRLTFLEDGDHSFKPRKSSGRTAQQNLEHAIAAVAAFVKEL